MPVIAIVILPNSLVFPCPLYTQKFSTVYTRIWAQKRQGVLFIIPLKLHKTMPISKLPQRVFPLNLVTVTIM